MKNQWSARQNTTAGVHAAFIGNPVTGQGIIDTVKGLAHF